MWYSSDVDGSYYIKYAESVDGKSWTGVRFLDLEFDAPHYPWHLDADYIDGKYELIIQTQTTTTEKNGLFYTYSYDNKNYFKPIKIIESSSRSDVFDGHNVYRASIVKVEDEYYIYYGTISYDNVFKIALTKGSTPLSLNNPNKYRSHVYVTPSNYFHANDRPNSYPRNQITITKITSDQGFPVNNGTLVTENALGEVARIRQTIIEYGSGVKYERHVLPNGEWSEFRNLAPRILGGEGQKIVAGNTVLANSFWEVDIPLNNASVTDNVTGNPNQPIEEGILFDYYISGENTVTLRYYNTTEEPIYVAPKAWNFTVIKRVIW